MDLKGQARSKLFGFDSKCIYKEWVKKDGSRLHVKLPVGVCVHTGDNEKFETDYEEIMVQLFQKFGITKERRVYASSEIGSLFPPDSEEYANFCLGFTREIMKIEDAKFTFFYTDINKKHLKDGKVTINGEYGSPTEDITVEEFIDKTMDSYNVICAWKVMSVMKLRKANIILDGTSAVRDCAAWEYLRDNHNVRIMYNADKIVPLVSAADILVRNLEFFIKKEKARINEDTLKKIIHYEGKISEDEAYYYYIGNPDLKYIKQRSSRTYTGFDLKDYLHRPIIYASAGQIQGQKEMLESGMGPIYDLASTMGCSVKIFDPNKDSKIIGKDPEKEDYFFPFNKLAEEILEIFVRSKRNVKRLEP